MHNNNNNNILALTVMVVVALICLVCQHIIVYDNWFSCCYWWYYLLQKTRAEAMLERAKLQPQQSTVDPLDNAARWSIPIWPLEKVSIAIL
jgi:hypothetical protein